MSLGIAILVLLSFHAHVILASNWKREHLVTGLPLHNKSEELKSYAGLVPIRKDVNGIEVFFPRGLQSADCQSGLFYWLFEAEEPQTENPPLVLWIQGGPGASSGIGLFYEFGPYTIDENLSLQRNPYSWTKHYDVLFVDNPVGTGYSYVYPPARAWKGEFPSESQHPVLPPGDINYDQGYVINQDGVSQDMLSFLCKFYHQFPEKRNSQLYLTSESYGGKYVPSIATAVLNYNEKNEDKIPLEGISIGNQWTDPNTQILAHASQAFYLGLVDEEQSQHLLFLAQKAVAKNLKGDGLGALQSRLEMFDKYNEYTGSGPLLVLIR